MVTHDKPPAPQPPSSFFTIAMTSLTHAAIFAAGFAALKAVALRTPGLKKLCSSPDLTVALAEGATVGAINGMVVGSSKASEALTEYRIDQLFAAPPRNGSHDQLHNKSHHEFAARVTQERAQATPDQRQPS